MLVGEMHDFKAADKYCASQLRRLKASGVKGEDLPPLYVYMLRAYLKDYTG